jgi:uncharacterized protein (TIGR01777 family)
MHVFVTGATGLIGRALTAGLVQDGHQVSALSRGDGTGLPPSLPSGLPSDVRWVQGDPSRPGDWEEVLAACEACVHLAGEPVAAGRWTEERKRRIRDSRVESTARVAAVLARRGPRVLVLGSAVGYYGSRGDELLDEASPPGGDFLARVTQDWEAAARPAQARARVVLLRTGLVLSGQGGALPRLVQPFRAFVGGPIGDGAFWMPWIHLADELGLIRLALEDGRVSGPVNGAAPEPVRNRDFARLLGQVLHRPSLVRTPTAALRAILGELASALTASQRVVPRGALALGYRFRFPALEPALAELLG